MRSSRYIGIAVLILLICYSSSFAQTRNRTRPVSRTPSTPSTTSAEQNKEIALPKHQATVNLKDGAPVTGGFIGADTDGIQLEVAGNKITIKLAEITTVIFSAPPQSQTPEPATNKSSEAASSALKSLRKLSGATEVGINFREYGSRLIDVKSEVDEALVNVPDGELKDEIRLGLESYVDAGQAWNRMIGGGGSYSEPSLYPDSDPWANLLQKKYGIPTELVEPGKNVPDYLRKTAPAGALNPFRAMRQSTILNTIWATAKGHIDKGQLLLKP